MRPAFGVLALAAACSFPGNDSPAGDAGGGPDAPVVPGIDGMIGAIDAMPGPDGAWCRAETDPATDQSRGRVGGSNGGARPDLLCDQVDHVIVGIAIEMSDGDTYYNGRSARGIRIACAPLTLVAGGASIVGAQYTKEERGTGVQGWSPSTWSGVTSCPPGWLVSGLQVHTGSGSDANRFIDLTMQCKELGADATPTGMAMDIYVAGSGDENSGNEQATCEADEVLRMLEPVGGAGLDSVGLVCAQPRCAP